MPANYAHYRFAKQVQSGLSEAVHKHKALYLAGCHGPDPLFYYNPFRTNAVSTLAEDIHQMSGREIFTRACERLRKTPDAEGYAYLYGLLTHYCLDSGCHGFVNDLADRGLCDHTELETEFDRYLMTLDGETAPHLRDLGSHVVLTSRQCAQAAAFYPPMTGRQYAASIRNMKAATRILCGKTILRRPLLEKTLPAFSGSVRYQLMTKGTNKRVCQFNEKLLALYQGSLERFPGLSRQLEAHLNRRTPLGEDFTPIFG